MQASHSYEYDLIVLRRGELLRAGHEVANHMMDDVASWYLSKVGTVSYFRASPSRQFFEHTDRSAA